MEGPGWRLRAERNFENFVHEQATFLQSIRWARKDPSQVNGKYRWMVCSSIPAHLVAASGTDVGQKCERAIRNWNRPCVRSLHCASLKDLSSIFANHMLLSGSRYERCYYLTRGVERRATQVRYFRKVPASSSKQGVNYSFPCHNLWFTPVVLHGNSFHPSLLFASQWERHCRQIYLPAV